QGTVSRQPLSNGDSPDAYCYEAGMETQSISPSSPARRRKHYSTAEKESILDAFEQSGLSAKAFCLQQDISVVTLANWRRQRR
ncbi:MAG: hypothetical protein P5685_26260, partial [Limnospira sp. PMC 1261.20]